MAAVIVNVQNHMLLVLSVVDVHVSFSVNKSLHTIIVSTLEVNSSASCCDDECSLCHTVDI